MKSSKKKNKDMNISKPKLYLIFGCGFLLLIVPFVSLIMDPLFQIIVYLSRIAEGSPLHALLQQETPGAYMQIYLFNITNQQEFLSEEDKVLRVEEVGPFTYREFRKNENFELDEEAGVMRYKPNVKTEFIPEESIGDPRDFIVNVANPALLAMTTMLSTYSSILRLPWAMLTREVKSQAIITLDAHSFMWGYDEPLISIGNKFMPGWIHFDKMGILDRLYDQSKMPLFEVDITAKNKFKVKSINGRGGLDVWHYDNPSKRTHCNTFEDTYEGLMFHPGLKPGTPLRLYRNLFCRMLDLDYVGTRTLKYGPEALIYKLSNKTFSRNPSTECLCGKEKCLDGVSDMSPCLYGLNLGLSKGHFLDSDPKLYERIEGIYPDEEKHGGEILIDPKSGFVVSTSLSLQLNIMVGDVNFNLLAKPFSNMVVPVTYFKVITPELSEEYKGQFRLFYFLLPYVVHGLEALIFVVALLVLVYAARQAYWNLLYSEKMMGFNATQKEISILHAQEPLMDKKILELEKNTMEIYDGY